MDGPIPCVTVPHHITAFFVPVIVEGDSIATGSLGAGLLLYPLARVCYGTGWRVKEGPLARVLRILSADDLPVSVHEPLPAERGYATSAAVTLAGALAVSAFRGRSLLEAARAAHVAEVECRTGLGDVLALWEARGGVAVRVEAGAPGTGLVDYIAAPHSLVAITASKGREHTSQLLTKMSSREIDAAREALARLQRRPEFEVFVEEATSYSLKVGWLERLLGDEARRILSLEGVVGGYAKKKVAVFIVERDRTSLVAEELARLGFEVRVHELWSGWGGGIEWIYPEYAPPWEEG